MAVKINLENLIGSKYNNLTIIKEVDAIFTKGGNKKRMISCLCNCGVEKILVMSEVINGYVKSCGCYSRELAKENTTIRNTKHKMYGTSEYNTWQSMKKRCLNPNHKAYDYYGGRGITICDSWINSFSNFYNDMGSKPNKDSSLDRINNDKGYFKENCRWASKKTQTRNQRNNRYLTIDGVTKTIGEWAEISGIKWQTIHHRAFISNWEDKEILKPV